MTTYVIRSIRSADARDIYALNQDFNATFADFDEERVRQKIDIILTSTNDIVLVCEYNGRVVGYIHGSPYELLFADSLLNVLGFVVGAEARNQGIGGRLITRLEQWAERHGYAGVKLLTHPSRTAAHHFYERRGYVWTKDQKNYIKTFANSADRES
ncbi:GNAT family N-acetyltransferase [Paenibacillus aurantiacus]|uniref:GNAT family N-acetyltransferase n=1 Tax=Paenibacillus aurantiacus TaxID=1936118 RepID=A0ABV5KVM4_9BACL